MGTISFIKLQSPLVVLPEIKSLPLCCATAESLSSNCCIATCLPVAQTYLMGTRACLKKSLSGVVGREKRENKWVESKKKQIIDGEKKKRAKMWMKKEGTKWGEARKSDCKRNVGLCKSIHLSTLQIYKCVSTTWFKWEFMFFSSRDISYFSVKQFSSVLLEVSF